MLTDKDREWLEKRERVLVTHGLYSCAHCWHCTIEWDFYHGYCTSSEDYCLIVPDFRDAAEFEARAAAKLTETAGDIALLLKQVGLEQLSDWQLLRIVRIAVEAEMEQENK